MDLFHICYINDWQFSEGYNFSGKNFQRIGKEPALYPANTGTIIYSRQMLLQKALRLYLGFFSLWGFSCFNAIL